MSCRSYLFVPADNSRKLLRAAESEADALILDLEDAVAPASKAAARAEAARFLARPAPMARFVRVNGLTTGLTEDDVAATAAAGPDGYVLPKCEGPADIDALAALIARHDGAESIGIMAIGTETVRGLRHLMREAHLAKTLGFSGKMAIHPAQVPVIHAAFRPEPAEVDLAEAVIAALEAAGEGVASLNGMMLDRPHLIRARKILERYAKP